ncbi:atrial natriuretic peptide clearance receptor [Mytilus galloprovincialis]|uniref:Atrial natriuretic peptide clearance receptor n=1 Tax=Mytilus galloprovincialis TaxID=29158 RepID=A0A8B6E779_MYTGA|nr:atrial natriuretic peptide clearance receptor [Mytilus galloprovincialis]
MVTYIFTLLLIVCNFFIIFTLEPVKLGILLPSNSKFPFSIVKVVPAIDLALEHVNRSGLLPNHILIKNVRDSNCSETIGPLEAIDLYVKREVNVFIGPVCDYAVAPVARFAPYWSIPVISAGAPVKAFDDKSEYKTLTRIQGSYGKNADFLWEITRTFNWSTIGLLFNDNHKVEMGKTDNFFTMEPIYHMFKEKTGYEPYFKAFDEKYPLTYDIEDLLYTASMNARIVVLCASADSVRDILIKAHELNFDNGEYVFLNIDLFSSKNDSEKPWYRAGDTDERNSKAMKAYEALMTVTLRKPTSKEYKNFSMEVKRRAKEKNVNFTYGEEEVNSFVGAFHDAVILYALALNETLAANKSITDGAEITNRMWNRTFEGIYRQTIAANGDI